MWVFIIVVLTFVVASCNDSNEASNLNTPSEVEGASKYLRDEDKDYVIVFVHGVLGDARQTWTAKNGAYWPDLLMEDNTFKNFNIYVYDYPSPLFAVSLSISEVAENLRLLLEHDKVFDRHDEVIFLCHSMGGLIVRAFLLKYQRFAQKVKMIYFLSTPTAGSQVSKLASIVSENPQYAGMKPWDGDAYVGDQIQQWQAASFSIKSYCAYETRPTQGIQIVDRPSATNLCNQRVDPLDKDHFEIAKPSNKKAVQYIAFSGAVRQTYQIDDENDDGNIINQSNVCRNGNGIINKKDLTEWIKKVKPGGSIELFCLSARSGGQGSYKKCYVHRKDCLMHRETIDHMSDCSESLVSDFHQDSYNYYDDPPMICFSPTQTQVR